MQINSNSQVSTAYLKQTSQTTDKQTHINENINAKQISNAYFLEYSKQVASYGNQNFATQSGLFGIASTHIPTNLKDILSGIDLSSIGYNGKNLNDLSQSEANDLISENGFFGINQTSQRIADFVLLSASDDIDKLKAGREGILRGFDEAQKIWGGNLPDISHTTIQKSLQAIDKKLNELGETKIDITA